MESQGEPAAVLASRSHYAHTTLHPSTNCCKRLQHCERDGVYVTGDQILPGLPLYCDIQHSSNAQDQPDMDLLVYVETTCRVHATRVDMTLSLRDHKTRNEA